jgi:hypothetical protein
MDESEVRQIEVALAQAGWAEHARLEREFRVWSRLAQEVNAYIATVDDYTNDLCSRDYIAEFAARASCGLRTAIEERVSPADETFRGATVGDDDARLGRHFRIDQESAWWWHRRPSSGPLADYLAVE